MILFDEYFLNVKLTSVNKKFGNHPVYTTHKHHLATLFSIAYSNKGYKKPYTNPVSIMIFINTKKDIDNCNKLIYDALQEADIIADDKQIVHDQHFISRNIFKRGYDQLRIRIEGLEEDNFLQLRTIKDMDELFEIKLKTQKKPWETTP